MQSGNQGPSISAVFNGIDAVFRQLKAADLDWVPEPETKPFPMSWPDDMRRNDFYLLLSDQPKKSTYYDKFKDYLNNNDQDIRQAAKNAIALFIMPPTEKKAHRAIETLSNVLKSFLLVTTQDYSHTPVHYINHSDPIYFSTFLQVIRSLPKGSALQLLIEEEEFPSPERWDQISEAIVQSGVTHLNLSNFIFLTSPTVVNKVGPLQKLLSSKKLTTLNLSRCELAQLAGNELNQLCDSIEKSNIDSINLSSNDLHKLSPEAFNVFCNKILANPKIKEIDFANNNIDQLNEAQFKVFCSAIARPSLTKLSLTNNHINQLTKPRQKTLFASIHQSGMKTLDLNNNSLFVNPVNWLEDIEMVFKNTTNLADNGSLFNLNLENFKFLCFKLKYANTQQLTLLNFKHNIHISNNRSTRQKLGLLELALADNLNIKQMPTLENYSGTEFNFAHGILKRNNQISELLSEQHNNEADKLKALDLLSSYHGINASVKKINIRNDLVSLYFPDTANDAHLNIPEPVRDLYEQIRQLGFYGTDLQWEGINKGQMICELTTELEKTIDQFFIQHKFKLDNITQEAWDKFVTAIETSCLARKDALAKYRPAATIVLNILAIITGIGALALGVHLAYTKYHYNRALFFGQKEKTTSETKVENLITTVKNIRPPK